jgi:hypothetical protein
MLTRLSEIATEFAGEHSQRRIEWRTRSAI